MLVLGHSFVRNLETWVADQHWQGNVFETSVKGRQVYFDGTGGLKLEGLGRKLPAVMTKKRYECVVLEMGSNDLCERRLTAEMVVDGLFVMAAKLKGNYGVKTVVL